MIEGDELAGQAPDGQGISNIQILRNEGSDKAGAQDKQHEDEPDMGEDDGKENENI